MLHSDMPAVLCWRLIVTRLYLTDDFDRLLKLTLSPEKLIYVYIMTILFNWLNNVNEKQNQRT